WSFLTILDFHVFAHSGAVRINVVKASAFDHACMVFAEPTVFYLGRSHVVTGDEMEDAAGVSHSSVGILTAISQGTPPRTSLLWSGCCPSEILLNLARLMVLARGSGWIP